MLQVELKMGERDESRLGVELLARFSGWSFELRPECPVRPALPTFRHRAAPTCAQGCVCRLLQAEMKSCTLRQCDCKSSGRGDGLDELKKTNRVQGLNKTRRRREEEGLSARVGRDTTASHPRTKLFAAKTPDQGPKLTSSGDSQSILRSKPKSRAKTPSTPSLLLDSSSNEHALAIHSFHDTSRRRRRWKAGSWIANSLTTTTLASEQQDLHTTGCSAAYLSLVPSC